LKEYIDKVGEKHWISKISTKAIRFYILASLAAVLKGSFSAEVIIPTTIGLSAFNTFILENLFKQWKPNQFIQNELLPSISAKAL
jgi:hypothetical protein